MSSAADKGAAPGPDFKSIFEGMPGLYMVLDRELRIVAATEAYLRETLTRREDVIGRYVFDVFPDNPDDPQADSLRNSLASFNRVLRTGETDVMVVQRHDVRRPESDGGGFEERYWSPINSPIFDADGSVAYVLHRVENVTEFVKLRQKGSEQARTTDQLLEQTLQMEADLYARSREAAEASVKLKQANETLEQRVTERTAELQRAVVARKESEERFRIAQELSPDGFTIFRPVRDCRGNIVDFVWIYENAAIARMNGTDPEKVVGRRLLDLFPGHVGSPFLDAYKAVADSCEPRVLEAPYEGDSVGALTWFRVAVVPMGEDIAVLSQDITSRKQAEEAISEALSRAEERDRLLSALMEHVPEGIAITDVAMNLLLVSRQGEELVGAAYAGRPTAEVVADWKVYHPDGTTPMALEELPLVRAVERGEVIKDMELVQVNPQGRRRPLLCNAGPLRDSQGNIVGGVVTWRDITERKRSEEELRVQRQLLEVVVNKIPVQINVMRGGDLRMVLTNPAYQAIAPGKEMLGKTLDEIWPEAGRQFTDLCRKVLRTGEPYEVVDDAVDISRYPGGPTERRYFSWMLLPVALPGDGGRGVLNMSQETTDRKHAEDDLRESRAKLQAALNSMTDAVFISDAEGNFIDFNDAFATFHKFRSKDECAKTFDEYPDILDVYMADGTLAPVDMWAVPRALRGEAAANVEYKLRRKDTGETWYGSYSFAPIRSAEGAIVGSVVVGRDITDQKRAQEALKESEERFRTLADNISQLAWMAEADGYIFWYNKRWYEYTGTTPEEMQGWGWQKVHDPDALPQVTRQWEASLATGQPFDMEFPLKRADGSFRLFLTRVVPVKDGAGGVIRWFGTNTDVTDQRELEAHKRQFYRRTIEAATEGKLVVCERHDIEYVVGRMVRSVSLHDREELAEALNETRTFAIREGMPLSRSYEFLGCVTEAAANAVKHAGGGTLSLHRTDGDICCVVSDSGPGIGTMALPDVALTRGYSTAGTLGMGYKVMIHFADKVYLATGPEGTSVAVCMSVQEPKAEPTDDHPMLPGLQKI